MSESPVPRRTPSAVETQEATSPPTDPSHTLRPSLALDPQAVALPARPPDTVVRTPSASRRPSVVSAASADSCPLFTPSHAEGSEYVCRVCAVPMHVPDTREARHDVWQRHCRTALHQRRLLEEATRTSPSRRVSTHSPAGSVVVHTGAAPVDPRTGASTPSRAPAHVTEADEDLPWVSPKELSRSSATATAAPTTDALPPLPSPPKAVPAALAENAAGPKEKDGSALGPKHAPPPPPTPSPPAHSTEPPREGAMQRQLDDLLYRKESALMRECLHRWYVAMFVERTAPLDDGEEANKSVNTRDPSGAQSAESAAARPRFTAASGSSSAVPASPPLRRYAPGTATAASPSPAPVATRRLEMRATSSSSGGSGGSSASPDHMADTSVARATGLCGPSPPSGSASSGAVVPPSPISPSPTSHPSMVDDEADIQPTSRRLPADISTPSPDRSRGTDAHGAQPSAASAGLLKATPDRSRSRTQQPVRHSPSISSAEPSGKLDGTPALRRTQSAHTSPDTLMIRTRTQGYVGVRGDAANPAALSRDVEVSRVEVEWRVALKPREEDRQEPPSGRWHGKRRTLPYDERSPVAGSSRAAPKGVDTVRPPRSSARSLTAVPRNGLQVGVVDVSLSPSVSSSDSPGDEEAMTSDSEYPSDSSDLTTETDRQGGYSPSGETDSARSEKDDAPHASAEEAPGAPRHRRRRRRHRHGREPHVATSAVPEAVPTPFPQSSSFSPPQAYQHGPVCDAPSSVDLDGASAAGATSTSTPDPTRGPCTGSDRVRPSPQDATDGQPRPRRRQRVRSRRRRGPFSDGNPEGADDADDTTTSHPTPATDALDAAAPLEHEASGAPLMDAPPPPSSTASAKPTEEQRHADRPRKQGGAGRRTVAPSPPTAAAAPPDGTSSTGDNDAGSPSNGEPDGRPGPTRQPEKEEQKQDPSASTKPTRHRRRRGRRGPHDQRAGGSSASSSDTPEPLHRPLTADADEHVETPRDDQDVAEGHAADGPSPAAASGTAAPHAPPPSAAGTAGADVQEKPRKSDEPSDGHQRPKKARRARHRKREDEGAPSMSTSPAVRGTRSGSDDDGDDESALSEREQLRTPLDELDRGSTASPDEYKGNDDVSDDDSGDGSGGGRSSSRTGYPRRGDTAHAPYGRSSRGGGDAAGLTANLDECDEQARHEPFASEEADQQSASSFTHQGQQPARRTPARSPRKVVPTAAIHAPADPTSDGLNAPARRDPRDVVPSPRNTPARRTPHDGKGVGDNHARGDRPASADAQCAQHPTGMHTGTTAAQLPPTQAPTDANVSSPVVSEMETSVSSPLLSSAESLGDAPDATTARPSTHVPHTSGSSSTPNAASHPRSDEETVQLLLMWLSPAHRQRVQRALAQPGENAASATDVITPVQTPLAPALTQVGSASSSICWISPQQTPTRPTTQRRSQPPSPGGAHAVLDVAHDTAGSPPHLLPPRPRRGSLSAHSDTFPLSTSRLDKIQQQAAVGELARSPSHTSLALWTDTPPLGAVPVASWSFVEDEGVAGPLGAWNKPLVDPRAILPTPTASHGAGQGGFLQHPYGSSPRQEAVSAVSRTEGTPSATRNGSAPARGGPQPVATPVTTPAHEDVLANPHAPRGGFLARYPGVLPRLTSTAPRTGAIPRGHCLAGNPDSNHNSSHSSDDRLRLRRLGSEDERALAHDLLAPTPVPVAPDRTTAGIPAHPYNLPLCCSSASSTLSDSHGADADVVAVARTSATADLLDVAALERLVAAVESEECSTSVHTPMGAEAPDGNEGTENAEDGKGATNAETAEGTADGRPSTDGAVAALPDATTTYPSENRGAGLPLPGPTSSRGGNGRVGVQPSLQSAFSSVPPRAPENFLAATQQRMPDPFLEPSSDSVSSTHSCASDGDVERVSFDLSSHGQRHVESEVEAVFHRTPPRSPRPEWFEAKAYDGVLSVPVEGFSTAHQRQPAHRRRSPRPITPLRASTPPCAEEATTNRADRDSPRASAHRPSTPSSLSHHHLPPVAPTTTPAAHADSPSLSHGDGEDKAQTPVPSAAAALDHYQCHTPQSANSGMRDAIPLSDPSLSASARMSPPRGHTDLPAADTAPDGVHLTPVRRGPTLSDTDAPQAAASSPAPRAPLSQKPTETPPTRRPPLAHRPTADSAERTVTPPAHDPVNTPSPGCGPTPELRPGFAAGTGETNSRGVPRDAPTARPRPHSGAADDHRSPPQTGPLGAQAGADPEATRATADALGAPAAFPGLPQGPIDPSHPSASATPTSAVTGLSVCPPPQPRVARGGRSLPQSTGLLTGADAPVDAVPRRADAHARATTPIWATPRSLSREPGQGVGVVDPTGVVGSGDGSRGPSTSRYGADDRQRKPGSAGWNNAPVTSTGPEGQYGSPAAVAGPGDLNSAPATPAGPVVHALPSRRDYTPSSVPSVVRDDEHLSAHHRPEAYSPASDSKVCGTQAREPSPERGVPPMNPGVVRLTVLAPDGTPVLIGEVPDPRLTGVDPRAVVPSDARLAPPNRALLRRSPTPDIAHEGGADGGESSETHVSDEDLSRRPSHEHAGPDAPNAPVASGPRYVFPRGSLPVASTSGTDTTSEMAVDAGEWPGDTTDHSSRSRSSGSQRRATMAEEDSERADVRGLEAFTSSSSFSSRVSVPSLLARPGEPVPSAAAGRGDTRVPYSHRTVSDPPSHHGERTSGEQPTVSTTATAAGLPPPTLHRGAQWLSPSAERRQPSRAPLLDADAPAEHRVPQTGASRRAGRQRSRPSSATAASPRPASLPRTTLPEGDAAHESGGAQPDAAVAPIASRPSTAVPDAALLVRPAEPGTYYVAAPDGTIHRLHDMSRPSRAPTSADAPHDRRYPSRHNDSHRSPGDARPGRLASASPQRTHHGVAYADGNDVPRHSSDLSLSHVGTTALSPRRRPSPCAAHRDKERYWGSPSLTRAWSVTVPEDPLGCGRFNPYCSTCRAKYNRVYVDDKDEPVRFPSSKSPEVLRLGDCRYNRGLVFGGPDEHAPLLPRSPRRSATSPSRQPWCSARGTGGEAITRAGPMETLDERQPAARTSDAIGRFVPVRFHRRPSPDTVAQRAWSSPSRRQGTHGELRDEVCATPYAPPPPLPQSPRHSSSIDRTNAGSAEVPCQVPLSVQPSVGAAPPLPRESSMNKQLPAPPVRETSNDPSEASADQSTTDSLRSLRREERRLRKCMKQLLWHDLPDMRDGEQWELYLESLTYGLDRLSTLRDKRKLGEH